MENDLVAVIVLGGRWSCVCSSMSDGLVEKWCNFIALVATGNQSSEKNICSCDFVVFTGAKGKTLEQCAVYNSWEDPWWVGRVGRNE